MLELGIMYKQEFENEPVEQSNIFKPATDTFMAAVPWTKNRMVVVFRLVFFLHFLSYEPMQLGLRYPNGWVQPPRPNRERWASDHK